MSVINYATEHADLRSWLTLPSNAQILRVSLPAGLHRIVATSMPGRATTTDVEILPKGKTLLRIVRVGKHFYSCIDLIPGAVTAHNETGIL